MKWSLPSLFWTKLSKAMGKSRFCKSPIWHYCWLRAKSLLNNQSSNLDASQAKQPGFPRQMIEAIRWKTVSTVKPNWIGPRATIRTQAKTDMELSRMTWEEPIMLDCLEPMRYQLPVCRKGFLRSLPSSLSSLKLILQLGSTWSKYQSSRQ